MTTVGTLWICATVSNSFDPMGCKIHSLKLLRYPLIVPEINIYQTFNNQPYSVQPITRSKKTCDKIFVYPRTTIVGERLYAWGKQHLSTRGSLGVPSNLRRLSFIIGYYDWLPPSAADTMWRSIIDILSKSSVTSKLKELNIVVNANRPIALAESKYLFSDDHQPWWLDIDSILGQHSHSPQMHAVNFTLNITSGRPSVTHQGFETMVKQQLPILSNLKKLSTTVCEDFDWHVLLWKHLWVFIVLFLNLRACCK